MVAPGTASAASYNGVCGSTYHEIDHHDINGSTIFLTYSDTTSKNCVITIRNNPSSTKVYIAASLEIVDGTLQEDYGLYTTWAGPVYVYAPHTCIDWGGGIDGRYWVSPVGHCK
jgi:hypothetical protein